MNEKLTIALCFTFLAGGILQEMWYLTGIEWMHITAGIIMFPFICWTIDVVFLKILSAF